jgi:16S rRNA (uracil1498-N3)-methyltransferase
MPRFFVPRSLDNQHEITMSGSEAHHMWHVLRLRSGDRVTIFDGVGNECDGEIIGQNRQTVTVRILESRRPRHEPSLPLIMGQSLVKGDKMDFIIQKATEMGVSSVIPFVSLRSVSRLEGPRMEKRLIRWRRIAVESSKQCGRMIPMDVEQVMSFHEILGWSGGHAVRIILWEGAQNRLKSLLRGTGVRNIRAHGVVFLVGPEGGFSEAEVKQAEKAHFTPASLGARILRAEAAGLSLISILQYEWGDMG